MTAEHLVEILHGVGFLAGAVLYGMLLAMVVQWAGRDVGRLWRDGVLAVITGLLGLTWNLGALALVSDPHSPPALLAVAYAALGLLAGVFVHVTVRSWSGDGRVRRAARWITGFAYVLAGGAAVAQLAEGARGQAPPSRDAFLVLAAGSLALVVAMVAASPAAARRRGGWLWMSALALFAVSAWHLGRHQAGAEGWPVVVLGHHASVPLVLAILWSDYRFALVDIFLKRALAVMALIAVVAGVFLKLFGAHLGPHVHTAPVAPESALAVVALAAAIALSYPLLRRASGWFVDRVLLKRPDAAALRAEVSRRLASCDTPADVLELVASSLAPALCARGTSWDETAGAPPAYRDLVRRVDRSGSGVLLTVPTAEPPHYTLRFEPLEGGRRILSDDVALLEGVALAAARRLDALRLLHERFERDLREELAGKLAAEAELTALQAQLNPHFLFNALNTLGYLMTAAPDRAKGTLADLTKLLRAVLKRSGGDLATLGDEVDLVVSYLAIEKARFEERLRVRVEVPAALRGLPVPPLIVQPLVENAIKHGIAPRPEGGEVGLEAYLEEEGPENPGGTLVIEVSDTGVGASESSLRSGGAPGVGLANVERRVHAHYGAGGTFRLASRPGEGTRATLRLRGRPLHRASRVPAVAAAGRGR